MRTRSDLDLWHHAVQLREDWLESALSTQPADRPTAEHALTDVYHRLGRATPRFVWVDSPRQAVALVRELPTLDDLYRWVRDPVPRGTPPPASNLATAVSRLRAALSTGVQHTDPELVPVRMNRHGDPWPELPGPQALAAGAPLGVVLHHTTRTSLHRTLREGFRRPVRDAAWTATPMPVCWYGQHDASWIAYYDVLNRLGLARYGPDETRQLDAWATLARSCGWLWPDDDVCVVVDRPAAVHVEPVPRGQLDELRVVPDGVTYRDGWQPHLA